MSNYRPKWLYATNFEGDHLTMKLSGMKRKHLQRLSKYIGQGTGGGISVSFDSQLEAFQVFAEILPDLIEDFKGLKDFEKHQDIPLDVVLEDIYFINLVSEIIEQIMDASTMSNDEVKLLKKPQGEQQRTLRTQVTMKA